MDTFTGVWVKDEQVNLNSPTTEWQHVVQVTGLDSNKNLILELTFADGRPVVFDGCTGNFNGATN